MSGYLKILFNHLLYLDLYAVVYLVILINLYYNSHNMFRISNTNNH